MTGILLFKVQRDARYRDWISDQQGRIGSRYPCLTTSLTHYQLSHQLHKAAN